ncbi:hypothetical protein D9M71_63720 [compost metagenome]
MALRNQGQLRQLQDFLHLEHVDGEELTAAQAEHEDFQPVLTHELGALIDGVENTGHGTSSAANTTVGRTVLQLFGKEPEN